MSGFTGPRDAPLRNSRPAVHRPGPGAPSLAGLRERYGERWDLFDAPDGSFAAVHRPRLDGFTWQPVVSAWDLEEFGARLAEADRAVRGST